MMRQRRAGQFLKVLAIAAAVSFWQPSAGWAQTQRPAAGVDQPDAQHTRDELNALLEHYPPALHSVLALDPSLMANASYMSAYPALASFISQHPEISRNPAFYIGESGPHVRQEQAGQIVDMWRDVVNYLGIFAGFAMAIGLLVWLIRTLVDYRRWSRLSRIQTDAHTKLLDRFTSNEDLLTYVQSPAGARFLQSAPIALDAAPRAVGAPLSRILWSIQGGVVILAGGIGLIFVSGRVTDSTSQQSLEALGIVAIALGLGFVVSAVISYLISQRLGLIEAASPVRTELPNA